MEGEVGRRRPEVNLVQVRLPGEELGPAMVRNRDSSVHFAANTPNSNDLRATFSVAAEWGMLRMPRDIERDFVS
jgi:hypothetical protein